MYYPTVRDAAMPTFEATLDELLSKRQALARDMLSGSGKFKPVTSNECSGSVEAK